MAAAGPLPFDFETDDNEILSSCQPLACAAARAALRVLRSEDLPRQAAEKGTYLLERLRDLQKRKRLIREVRGLGLMVGIEMRVKVAPLLQALQERGVLAINAGPMVLRLLPPLVIDSNQLDKVVAALDEVLT